MKKTMIDKAGRQPMGTGDAENIKNTLPETGFQCIITNKKAFLQKERMRENCRQAENSRS